MLAKSIENSFNELQDSFEKSVKEFLEEFLKKFMAESEMSQPRATNLVNKDKDNNMAESQK